MNKTTRMIVSAVAAVVFVAVGLLVMKALIGAREMPADEPRPALAALVESVPVSAADRAVEIHAQGVVTAAQQVTLHAEVSARVERLAPALVQGGVVAEGDTLVWLDDTDYRIAVGRAEATLAQAEAALAIEAGRGVIAEREWAHFQSDTDDDAGAALARREPQRREAEQRVVAAELALDQARVQVRRCRVRAPFNAYIQSESVEVGAQVGPGVPLATLTGTDAFYVDVSIPVSRVSHVDFPSDDDPSASSAHISLGAAGATERYSGHALRLIQELDGVGQMAHVIVSVPDPLGLSDDDAQQHTMPLFLGAWVDVTLRSAHQERLFEVPRQALRDGSRIYVRTTDNTLAIRDADIAWRTPSHVLIRSGIEPGEELVVSRLNGAVDGMNIRVLDDDAPQVAERASPATDDDAAVGGDDE